MPLATYKTEVNVSAPIVWELLLDKIERPDKYVPGVQKVDILERYDDGSVLREMLVDDGTSRKTVRERIASDRSTMTVIFKLPNDPEFMGFVTNTIFEEKGEVWLDYTCNWIPNYLDDRTEDIDFNAAIRGSVLHTKELAKFQVLGEKQ